MELIHRDEVENFMDKLNYDDSDEKQPNNNYSSLYNTDNDNIPESNQSDY